MIKRFWSFTCLFVCFVLFVCLFAFSLICLYECSVCLFEKDDELDDYALSKLAC